MILSDLENHFSISNARTSGNICFHTKWKAYVACNVNLASYTLSGTGNEYRPKWRDALRQDGSFHCVDKRVKLCDRLLTRANLSALEISIAHIIKRCTMSCLLCILYFTAR